LKRFKTIKPGFENWKYMEDKMSIADLLFHLIECDLWMFKILAGESSEPIKESRFYCHNFSEYEKLINEFELTGEERAVFIKSYKEEDFQRKVFDPRAGQNVTVLHFIIRGNLDHEIHHRGQLSMMMNLIEKN